jgi:hypothetical protein
VRGGYRIVRVIGREEGKLTPYEEAKNALREQMLNRRRAEEMEKLAKRLREHAIVQDMVREVPLAAVETQEAAPAKPSILDAVGGTAPGAAAPAGDEEFVTKRGEVKKVAPPPAEAGAPAQPPAKQP